MLYPPEVLNYSIRSTGMGMYAFWVNGLGLVTPFFSCLQPNPGSPYTTMTTNLLIQDSWLQWHSPMHLKPLNGKRI